MLRNQQFVDPSVAVEMHKLEEEMRRLIEMRVNIRNNNKIGEQVKERLLRYNEDERVRLRGLMEKGKLAMVEYLDRQVQVVSKECVMQGRMVDNNTNIKSQQQQYPAAVQKPLQTTRTRQSSLIVSSNHLTQTSRLSPSNSNTDNSSIIEQYKSCRQNLIHSDILQVNEFNITNHNIIALDQQHSRDQLICKYGKKRKLSAYMNYQQSRDNGNSISPQSMMMMTARQSWVEQQQQQSFQQIQQLYRQKIGCLQKKCIKLQQQNSQMKKIIHYQQKTIEQITLIIDQKERHLMEVQSKFIQREQMYKVKIQALGGEFNYLGQQVNRMCEELQSNEKMMSLALYESNQLNEYSQIHHYSPSMQPRPCASTESPQRLNLPADAHEISLLSKKLLQLQQSLKKIQSQNQQLKGERTLLLKKIKI